MKTQSSYHTYFCFVWMAIILTGQSVCAQRFSLDSLTVGATEVFYSAGQQQRAKEIAIRMDRAIQFNQKLIAFAPHVTVLVLSADDWSKHTSFPVYGMPHYTSGKELIVASSNNDYWRSFLPPLEQLDSALATKVRKTYGNNNGQLTMQLFFDLLAIHELGHAFHLQGGLTMHRKWMSEFFCNLLLHAYIAENEPQLLNALTVFPEMVARTGTKNFSFTTLDQFESNYNLIGKQHPKNYGWYQCRLHAAAKTVYETGGKESLIKLWKVLKESNGSLNNDELSDLLDKKVHPAVAGILRKW
jgi:hypothetical protein